MPSSAAGQERSWACRYRLKSAQRQQEREKTKVLKSLMYGLVNSPGDGKPPADQLRNARNLAFVITDLQSSTAQAATSPHAFLKIQEIHDTVRAADHRRDVYSDFGSSVLS